MKNVIWKYQVIALTLALVVSLLIPKQETPLMIIFLSSFVCSDLAWFFWNKKSWLLLCLLLMFFHVLALQAIGFVKIFTGNYSAAASSWVFAFDVLGVSFFSLVLLPIFAIAAYFARKLIDDAEEIK